MAAKPFVFISRGIPPMSRGLQLLKEQCSIKMYDESKGMVMPKEDLLASVRGAQGVLVIPPDKIDKEFLDAAGKKSHKNYS